MTIREVSAMTGMREDTLRYYEQIGLIPQVPRNKWGKRFFCFIKCSPARWNASRAYKV